MKKLVLIICLLFMCAGFVKSADIEGVQLELRDYDLIEIPQGTLIPVMNAQEISTQYCSEGYKVKFIVTDDMYMYDTNVVPKETAIYGYIEKINEPVVGTNASMKIRVSSMVYPNGVEIPVKGYLYNSNNNVFGGELSEPVKYFKMSQRQTRVHRTTLQVKPSWERKMGVHTTIPSGANGIVVLTAPAEITSALTN